MKIVVTKYDIQKGKRGNIRFCPIAIAFKKSTRAIDVAVYANGVVWNGHRFYIPPKAKEFIRKFDNMKKVKPFSFYTRFNHAS